MAFSNRQQTLLSVSPTSQTSPNGDFSKEKEHNMRYQETSDEVSQIADTTSDNANIMRPFANAHKLRG